MVLGVPQNSAGALEGMEGECVVCGTEIEGDDILRLGMLCARRVCECTYMRV